MKTESKLNLYKLALLKILNMYAGMEARQQQLVTDLQVGDLPDATPETVADALQALLDQDHASKRKDTYRGWVWKVTPEGHRVAEALALDE